MSKNRHVFRKFIHGVHKWLGLTIGLCFTLIGVTGSILVFYLELDSYFYPERSAQVQGQGASVDLRQIISGLAQAEPQRHGSWRVELPTTDGAPVNARYYKPVETLEKGFAPLILTLDPSSGLVTSKRFWGEDAFTWIYNLHYTLLLGSDGRLILGCLTLFTLLLLMTGIYLWWPSPRRWRQSLTIRVSSVWKKLVYDLHVVPMVYGAPIILVVTLTGLILVVPSWFSPTINAISKTTPYFAASDHSVVKEKIHKYISVDEAVLIAKEQFPDAQLRWIQTPGEGYPFWRIQMRQHWEPNVRFPKSNIWIDAESGQVLSVRDPIENTPSDSFFDWLHPLHNGESFGIIGRIAVALSGLLPLFAFVTGVVRLGHKKGSRTKKC